MSYHELYKNKYCIVFYDVTGEEFKYLFNNAREILEFQGKKVTKKSMQNMNNVLYKIFQKGINNNICTFLNGEKLRVYLIDI